MAYLQEAWRLDAIMGGASVEEASKTLQKIAADFETRKDSLNPGMSAAGFSEIISEVEGIVELSNRISGYAALRYAEDTQSEKAAALRAKTSQLSSEVSNRIVFLEVWWKRVLDDANARRLMDGAGDLAEYLSHQRRLARHTLAESEEKIINLLDVTGPTALVKIYDTITNAYTYDIVIDGQKKTLGREELAVYFRSPVPRYRQDAYQALLGRYESSRNVLGEIYRNIVQNHRNEYLTVRGYDSPISVMNAQSNLEDSTVQSLLDTCRECAPVFQDYFAAKASMLEMKKLTRYDIYAPYGKTETRYPYTDAVGMVLDALDRFSAQLAGYAKGVFTEGHVHSTLQKGKMSGAFCSTISPRITPFVLLNYTGESRDVLTLAHEIGHAVHSVAASKRSILVQHAPLPLAETASTFSEMLLYDAISADMQASEEAAVLAGKLDDLYATISRQSFFTIFEMRAHQMLVDGATPAEVSAAYADTLKEQFGDSVAISWDFASEWLAVPHFYHHPFYCYSYSFGNLLTASLFQRYKKEGRDFAGTYLEILTAGGSRKPEELMAAYGFDIGSANFWREGFGYVRSLVDRIMGLAA